jgi:hypothetical protein
MNDGKGNFSKSYQSSSQYGYGAIADVNNDGMSDIIVSTSDASNLVVWTNQLNNGHIYKANFGGDTLLGSTSNDSFYAGDGQDNFNGNGGLDTSAFSGQRNNFNITQSTKGWIVGDKIFVQNIDNLIAISRLKFSDTNVALDIAPTQNAGSVYMLYKAAFNRAPDNGGMGYWLAQKDSGKDIVTSLAQGFVGSKEFTDKYGTNPSNASYVDKLYQNVLGRTGESGGVTYWNQELDAGRISKAAVLVEFATLAEGAAKVASLIANGIPYTEYVG